MIVSWHFKSRLYILNTEIYLVHLLIVNRTFKVFKHFQLFVIGERITRAFFIEQCGSCRASLASKSIFSQLFFGRGWLGSLEFVPHWQRSSNFSSGQRLLFIPSFPTCRVCIQVCLQWFELVLVVQIEFGKWKFEW